MSAWTETRTNFFAVRGTLPPGFRELVHGEQRLHGDFMWFLGRLRQCDAADECRLDEDNAFSITTRGVLHPNHTPHEDD